MPPDTSHKNSEPAAEASPEPGTSQGAAETTTAGTSQEKQQADIQAAEAEVAARKSEKGTGPIYSLLIDKQSPLLGIKWGGSVFVDAPLNGEPDNAQVTLRRLKLTFWKSFGPNWQIKLSAQYNKTGGLELNDNYVTYSGWQTARGKFGVFSAPYSLENLSSSDGITFMERALPVVAISDNKSAGFGLLKRTRNSIFDAGLFLAGAKRDDVPQDGQSLVLHYVHSPIDAFGSTGVHIGGSFSYRINASGNNTAYRSRPEVGVAGDYFVDTGNIDGSDQVFRFGLEASSVMGRFSWQAELMTSTAQRKGYPTVTFKGGYALVSWFLTDDSRNYNAGRGYYDPVIPNSPLGHGGRGAFEVAARISYVDLNDKDIIGGQETNITLGLNWYLNTRFRVMFNVVKVLDVNRPGNEWDGQDPLILAMRGQWAIQ